jgi:hypothetical protein
MSKDKRKAFARQGEMLQTFKNGRLYLNCEGRPRLTDKKVQELLKSGRVRLKRDPGVPKWTKKFYHRPTHYHGRYGEGFIRLSYLEIVE